MDPKEIDKYYERQIRSNILIFFNQEKGTVREHNTIATYKIKFIKQKNIYTLKLKILQKGSIAE